MTLQAIGLYEMEQSNTGSTELWWGSGNGDWKHGLEAEGRKDQLCQMLLMELGSSDSGTRIHWLIWQEPFQWNAMQKHDWSGFKRERQ